RLCELMGVLAHAGALAQRGTIVHQDAHGRKVPHQPCLTVSQSVSCSDMKIAVVGTGYVGLVVGACLAENGNTVVCVDKDASKIDMLKAGRMPIYEPGLEEIVRRNDHEERLAFSTDLPSAVRASGIVVIAVGT